MMNKRINSKVLIVIDAEVYDRLKFRNYIEKCIQQTKNLGGELVFEGMAPEIIEGDWKPRNTFLVMKWESEELFHKWWISAEHRALRHEQKEISDLKVVKIQIVSPL